MTHSDLIAIELALVGEPSDHVRELQLCGYNINALNPKPVLRNGQILLPPGEFCIARPPVYIRDSQLYGHPDGTTILVPDGYCVADSDHSNQKCLFHFIETSGIHNCIFSFESDRMSLFAGFCVR